MAQTKKQLKRSPIWRLVTPSLLSACTVLVVATGITALAIIIFMTNAGTLQQNLINWHRDTPPKTLTLPGQELPQNDQPTLLGSWPLIALWAMVGLLLYGLASYIVHTFVRAAHFRQNYTKVSALPHEVFESLVRQLELRFTALIILLILLYLIATRLAAYCILLSRASAADFTSFSGIAYAAVSCLVLVVSLHAALVFTRLTLGRVRLFS